MKVNIDEKWVIESDGVQFILKEKQIVKEGENAGKEYETTIGYFTTIHSIFNRILKIKLMESTAETIQELQQDVKRIEKWFENKFIVQIYGKNIVV